MSISDMFSRMSRQSNDTSERSIMDIIEFVESPYGLNMTYEGTGVALYPVQKFIIKAFYNLPLEDKERTIRIPKNWRYTQSAKPEHYYEFTEAEYMRYLFNEGRCNIQELDEDRRELILPIGRRSGKSFISSIIGAYETYRLLRKNNPQKYYGVQEGAEITLSTVAPTKDQAKILYSAIGNHFQNCDFFTPYLSHNTQSFIKFQTPHDIDATGNAGDGGRASYQIRFFASSSSGIRGHANIVVILDEAAHFNSKGGSSAKAVYDAVTPSTATFNPTDPNDPTQAISSHSEGRVILISSPLVKSGLFYDQYSKSKSGSKAADNILMVQAPTWEVNPKIGVGYLENFHSNDPVVFATEFGSQFTDRVSSWIEREKDLLACIDFDLRADTRGRSRVPYYMGLDVAVIGDRTSVALTRPEGDHIRLAYHEEWQAGENWYDLNPHLTAPFVPYANEIQHTDALDFDEIANWLYTLSRKFYIEEGIFDQWSGISLQQTLNKLGLKQVVSKQFTKDESSRMFDAFKTLMFHQKLLLYDYVLREVETEEDDAIENAVMDNLDSVKHAPYITQILELRAERKSKKVVDVRAPDTPGKHDDFADALVRSVWLSVQHLDEGNVHISGSRASAQERARNNVGPQSVQAYRRNKMRRNNYVGQRGDRLARLRRYRRRR